MQKRKRRSDRKHLIYRIDNIITGEFYIGVTVVTGRAFNKSLQSRFKRHISRAIHEDKKWSICESIRFYGSEAFKPSIIEHVRGKAEAHKRETELIHELRPQLNSTIDKQDNSIFEELEYQAGASASNRFFISLQNNQQLQTI
tara:strand:+ start:1285 stop:1713 length:429 start_codon:yes stop_codon:yes gene_type:complete